jgi:hypothetical protein
LVAKAEARGPDPFLFEAGGGDGGHRFRFHNPAVQLAIAEQEQAAIGIGGSLTQFVPSEHPSAG